MSLNNSTLFKRKSPAAAAAFSSVRPTLEIPPCYELQGSEMQFYAMQRYIKRPQDTPPLFDFKTIECSSFGALIQPF